jgi:putative aldouronate transport system substrate-binding protein
MKSFKSLFAMVLCLILAISFSACGAGGNSGTAAATTAGGADTAASAAASEPAKADPLKNKLEISLAFWQDGDAFPTTDTKDAITSQIEKDLNITVKPVLISWTDYQEKYKLWASSNSLPDVLADDGIGNNDIWPWQSQGVIRPLPADLSPYPYLKKVLDIPQTKLLFKDGKYWAIPRIGNYSAENQYTQVILMYKDIYDSLGLSAAPVTMDDFIKMFEQIKTKYPNKVPLTTHTIKWTFSLMRNYNPYGDAWTLEDGKWIPGFFSKTTLEGIKAIKPFWDENLIDKDFTINGQSFNGQDKFINGDAASIIFTPFTGHWTQQYIPKWNAKHPDQNMADALVVLNMPTKPDKINYIGEGMLFWSESYISAKVDDEKFDRILRLYDYLESPKGMDLRWYGIEGTDFTKAGDSYTITRAKDKTGAFTALQSLYKSEIVWQPLSTWNDDFAWTDPSNDPKVAKMGQDWLQWKAQNSRAPENYNIMISALNTPLKSKFSYNANADDLVRLFISKGDLDKQWNDLMQKYKDQGYDAFIDEVNTEAKNAGLIN